MTQFCFAML